MKERLAGLIGATALSVVFAGCSGDGTPPTTPTSPLASPIAGNWVGVFESGNYATRPIAFTLAQTGASMAGTWEFPNAGQGQGGKVTGTVAATVFTGTVSYDGNHDPQCRASFTGTVSNDALNWSSPGFQGVCGIGASENPIMVRLVLRKP